MSLIDVMVICFCAGSALGAVMIFMLMSAQEDRDIAASQQRVYDAEDALYRAMRGERS